jgi:hypothetical protein
VQSPTECGEFVRPIKQRSRWSRWFKRNERLLSFLGAFIVFSTFATKETISDHYKGRGEAAEKALKDLREQDFQNRLFATLTTLQRSLPADPNAKVQSDDERKLNVLNDQMMSLMGKAATAKILAKALDRKDYESGVEARLKRSVEIYDDIGFLKRGLTPEPGHLKDVASVEAAVYELSVEEEKFQSDADRETEKLAKKMSEAAHRWTIIGWSLYAFGWAIGLAGRLIGGGGSSGE